MVSIIDEEVKSITREILEDYTRGRDIDKMDDLFDQLDKDMIIQIIQKLLKIIYPGYYRIKLTKSMTSTIICLCLLRTPCII